MLRTLQDSDRIDGQHTVERFLGEGYLFGRLSQSLKTILPVLGTDEKRKAEQLMRSAYTQVKVGALPAAAELLEEALKCAPCVTPTNHGCICDAWNPCNSAHWPASLSH
jgi:hypothetical protein